MVCVDNVVIEPVAAPAIAHLHDARPVRPPLQGLQSLREARYGRGHADVPEQSPAQRHRRGRVQHDHPGELDEDEPDPADARRVRLHGHRRARGMGTNERPRISRPSARLAHPDARVAHRRHVRSRSADRHHVCPHRRPHGSLRREVPVLGRRERGDRREQRHGLRSTVWHDTIGDDFIDLAFTHAHAADPNAKLLYNDYNIEQKGNAKADIRLQHGRRHEDAWHPNRRDRLTGPLLRRAGRQHCARRSRHAGHSRQHGALRRHRRRSAHHRVRFPHRQAARRHQDATPEQVLRRPVAGLHRRTELLALHGLGPERPRLLGPEHVPGVRLRAHLRHRT